MKKIIVFGSINADLSISTNRIPSNGETMKGNGFTIGHGGKGANQAVAAAKLGAEVRFIACVGDDEFGREGISSLKRRKIDPKYIHTMTGIPTGIAIIIKTHGDNRIILDEGANQKLTVEHFMEALEQEEFANSILITQLENNVDETTKVLKLAKEKEMFTILNPAPALKLDAYVYQYIDLLILNQTETQELTDIYPNNLHDMKEIYRVLSIHGIKTMIITLGKEGSVILSEDVVQKIEPHPVETIDTTGAGDSYIGAIAYGLSQGKSLVESAKLASLVSALCVTKYGAQRSMPDFDEIEAYLKNNEVK